MGFSSGEETTSEPNDTPVPTANESRYWRVNVALVAGLMSLGFGVSFVFVFFARALIPLHWFGWGVPYYMAAQGAILAYLLLVTGYALAMAALDRRVPSHSEESL